MMANFDTDTSFVTLKCHSLFTFDRCEIFQELLKRIYLINQCVVLVEGVSATLAALTPRLKDFHQLLVDPPPVSHDTFLFPLILFLFVILVTVVYSSCFSFMPH